MHVIYYYHITFYIATLFIALNAFFKINMRLNYIIFHDIIRLKNLQKSTMRENSRILAIGYILAVFHVSI